MKSKHLLIITIILIILTIWLHIEHTKKKRTHHFACIHMAQRISLQFAYLLCSQSEEKSIYKSCTLEVFVCLTSKTLHPRIPIKNTLFSYHKRSVKTGLLRNRLKILKKKNKEIWFCTKRYSKIYLIIKRYFHFELFKSQLKYKSIYKS